MKIREMEDIVKLEEAIHNEPLRANGFNTIYDEMLDINSFNKNNIVYETLYEKKNQKIREYGSDYSNDRDLYDFILREAKSGAEKATVEPNNDRYVQLAKKVRFICLFSIGCLIAFLIILFFW